MSYHRKQIRKLLTAPVLDLGLATAPSLWQFHRRAFLQACTLVRVYYLFTLFLFYNHLSGRWAVWASAKEIQPLWPVAWVTLIPLVWAANFITLNCLMVGVAALIYPEKRLVRIWLLISLLFFTAMLNSFGKINHSLHTMLVPAFFFIFLPDQWQQLEKSISGRQKFLRLFWAAQTLILTFYTMSGLLKILFAILQIRNGEIHAFHPEAFSLQIAQRLMTTNSQSLLGPWLVRYSWLGWLPYVTLIYIETFALLAAFRPVLHRLWGISLIVFHLGTWLTMAIPFIAPVMVVGILLVCSPFQPPALSPALIIQNLPIVGTLWASVQRVKQ